MARDEPDEGRIAGAVLRAIRESLNLTQDELAEALAVDRNTVKGWETGRRPLASRGLGRAISLRQRLRLLGADAALVHALTAASDADWLAGQLLTGPRRLDQHPLATCVIARDLSDLLSWPFTGRAPAVIRRFAPTSRAPAMTVPEREVVLDGLRRAAEASAVRWRADDANGALLRRQAGYFTAQWITQHPGWLAELGRQELHRAGRLDRWTPSWVSVRSLSVARACQGDPEPLREFIGAGLAHPDTNAANLNYWAYWTGEASVVMPHVADDFMVTSAGSESWRGTGLLRRLTANLTPATPYLDLCVHTAWALITQRPYLLHDDPKLASALLDRAGHLVDMASPLLSAQSRQELDLICTTVRPTVLVKVG